VGLPHAAHQESQSRRQQDETPHGRISG
jgi:hypothetical protein